MSFDHCQLCGTWHKPGAHRPEFTVELADDLNEYGGVIIHASDAEEAAERFLNYLWDEHGPDAASWLIPFPRGEADHVVIVKDACGERSRFEVHAEMQPHFSARETDIDDEENDTAPANVANGDGPQG